MSKVMFMSINKKREIFSPCLKIEEIDSFSTITVKNSNRAIRKSLKKLRGKNVVLTLGEEKNKKLLGYVREYRQLSYVRVLPILKNLCKAVAGKYNVKIPFEDFYIIASPAIALSVAEKLSDMSRMFTVISDEEVASSFYDELYFKHGILIRQLPAFNNNIPKDSVVLRCNAEKFPRWAKVPVIDLSPAPENYEMAVDVRSVCVKDSRMEPMQKIWKGKSSVVMYELMDEFPDFDQDVSLGEKADKIFLLDTEGF